MQSSQPPPRERAECPICRGQLLPGNLFCAVCGAQLDAISAREEELRGVLYLLSELEGWESSGRIERAQAVLLRESYERRRDELRRELAERASGKQRPPVDKEERATFAPHEQAHTAALSPERAPGGHNEFVAFPPPTVSTSIRARPQASAPPPALQRPRRTLTERLADPQTLRLLLYTGAAMFVVSIVLWLRDILYLKLQEPIVQAGLLALVTVAVTAAGWYIILRTRQRWTGRALTLAGSLLFPVNFWFLVRSGLLSNQGRAWVVCALCALLYAYTAALLRERLYVYLSSAAAIATAWALILRDAPRAFGLYALTLMTASLIFLHLSRLFPAAQSVEEKNGEDAEEETNRQAFTKSSRWSRELWSVPLVRTALFGAIASIFIYMPLRLANGAPSFDDGIFRLRASTYDASIALMLFVAVGYALWFTGRYVSPSRRVLLQTASTLALFVAVWITGDGFRLTAQTQLLMLALATFLAASVARLSQSEALSQSLYYASLLAGALLAIMSLPVVVNAPELTLTESTALALLALTFGALSATRFNAGTGQVALAHICALYFSAAYFVALASARFRSETLVTLLCAGCPLALYGAGQAARFLKRETQLTSPFTRVADVEFLLLLMWGAILALFVHGTGGGASRTALISALAMTVLYGALRSARERSLYGTALGTLASVIMVAALFDALQKRGLWPASWPIAASTIAFAFLLQQASARLFRQTGDASSSASASLLATVRIVLDVVVTVCSLLWLINAFANTGAGRFGAASVLLLALLYWSERAFQERAAWTVYLASAHTGAFFITLMIALRVDAKWFAFLFALVIFPFNFILSRYAHRNAWLLIPLSRAAVVALALALSIALVQASPHLQAGNAELLAPSLTAGAVALLSFVASMFSRGLASVRYFRAGLWISPLALALLSLRSGFDPIEDAEVYTTPVAVLLLTVAYLSLRRAWEEYDRDAGLLLWAGSLLLCGPLLARALEYRLLLDTAAPWRDVGVLIASLALILYGVVGRMRAPVMVGAVALVVELCVLTLVSVDWLQVPLKYYLMTVGALLLIIFGTLEYRREQFLLMRKRFMERRDLLREQFGEWR